MATPADIISTARMLYNDTDSVLLRIEDTELLAYFNDGMREVSGLQPAVFNTIGDFECVAGQCDQAVTFPDAQALIKVQCIHGGNVVHEADMKSLDAFLPGWRTATAAAAVNWMREPGDPLRFFIYPKAPVDQTLDVMYVRNPTVLVLADTITEIPSGYFPAMVDYLVYRAESRDDEHSNSGRAAAHYQAFVAKIKGATA